MTQDLKQIRRPREADYHTVMKRSSVNMLPADYRCMLANITLNCYVEAEFTCQSGRVVDIIRDRFGIPACFKVKYSMWNNDGTEVVGWGYDYIQPADVTLFEFACTYVPNEEYQGCYMDEALEDSNAEGGGEQ